MYKCSKERLGEKIKAFSKYGNTGLGGITRLSLTRSDISARNEFCRRCAALGMYILTDDMANIYATLPGEDDSLPGILAGSHCDSVRHGGNYDGMLGVLTAVEAAETIVRDKIPHKHPITLAIWTNSEGARFKPIMMGSGVITGKYSKSEIMCSVSTDFEDGGMTFGEALEESGYAGDLENRASAEKYIGMVELHIEQGPVLDDAGIDIGVVEGVCCAAGYEFTIKGQADHAGAVPMENRRDALYSAARLIQILHNELDREGKELVYTIGKISCMPNTYRTVPEMVKFSLDVRHQDKEVMKRVYALLARLEGEVERCSVRLKRVWSREGVKFFDRYVNLVEASAKELGYSHMRMYSGPGHDAQFLSYIMPAAMVFVPSNGGHAQCEREYTHIDRCAKGADVLLNTILKMDVR